MTAGPLTVAGKRGIIRRYFEHLPVSDATPIVTLDEGDTPLIFSERLSLETGAEVWLKYEGLNPTGSFKDRGMTVAVTRAKSLGAKALVCASTGNTAASLAAYGARAGIPAVVVVPQGGVASGKLGQAFAHGARVFGVTGTFDNALKVVFDLVQKDVRFYLVNSVNPFRVEGQKVAAFEIYEQLGGVPDYVVLPVGNAGNISAIWKGFKELRDLGIAKDLPAMIGVQAEGAAPLATAFSKGTRFEPWSDPRTEASAIRIGNPVSWKKALRAVNKSGGKLVTVSDKEILTARARLSAAEGVLVEAASAAPIAALASLGLPSRSKVVCIATGTGFKDLAEHGFAHTIEPAHGADSIIQSVWKAKGPA